MRSVSFSNGRLHDREIIFRYSEMKRILYFVSLADWLRFWHAKLTAGGEQTHTLTQTRKRERRETESSSLHSISGLQINV